MTGPEQPEPRHGGEMFTAAPTHATIPDTDTDTDTAAGIAVIGGGAPPGPDSGIVELDLGLVPDEHGRARWNIIATKLPHADRDVAHAVMPDEAAATDRGFTSFGRGADCPDDDPVFPVGAEIGYSLLLDDLEAAAFAAASNAVTVTRAQPMSIPTGLSDTLGVRRAL